jgi:hypothetical protein
MLYRKGFFWGGIFIQWRKRVRYSIDNRWKVGLVEGANQMKVASKYLVQQTFSQMIITALRINSAMDPPYKTQKVS